MVGYFPFQGTTTITDELNQIIVGGGEKLESNLKALENEIKKFLNSPKRMLMLESEKYYEYEHPILFKQREAIGEGGLKTVVENIPNNTLIDNQYAFLVDQKANYSFAKPFVLETDNDTYQEILENEVFNYRMRKMIKNTAVGVLNNGINYWHPYYDEQGNFKIKRFAGHEFLPLWADADHTILESGLRIYTTSQYNHDNQQYTARVDHYTKQGIFHYLWTTGQTLVPFVAEGNNGVSSYLTQFYFKQDGALEEVQYYTWERLPIIPIKANDREISLLKRVKTLQDAYNKIWSTFMDRMEEDVHNTILILENYDGQNLGEFRRNLMTYGAVKVRTTEGGGGGVKTLHIEVNKENFEFVLAALKKAIIENGKGCDVKELRSGNPNQMNIQSAYMDIDLDANDLELEFQSALEELLWFINKDLANKKKGNFDNEKVNIIFNRDQMINEKEVVETLEKSPYMSLESKLTQHPYVKDVQLELQRIEQELKKEMDLFDNYDTTFRQKQNGGEGDEGP